MTIYEPNPDVKDTGAEVSEFIEVPDPSTTDSPPPRAPSSDPESTSDETES